MKDLFPDTRPYNDDEIPAAMARIAAHPQFETCIHHLYPNADMDLYKQQLLEIKTIEEFQSKVMFGAIRGILAKSSDGASYSGFENILPNQRYLFVANHRDIVLDAAILQVILQHLHLPTSEITFGSNLMQGQLIIDIGKSNKMFRIVRTGTAHDFYKNSLEVSSYMRYALLEKRESVWIAQRNGRSKDGNDKTEPALLKMFAMSSSKPFVDNLNELQITPVSISYEYEPCDFLRTQELYIRQYQQYVKEPGEDANSIINGITQRKGHIHLTVAPPITHEELTKCYELPRSVSFTQLAHILDLRIYEGYKLWKNNYIAHDLLRESNHFASHYSADDKKEFIEYMLNGLSILRGDMDELRTIFLKIYANPITNKINNALSTQTEWKTNNL